MLRRLLVLVPAAVLLCLGSAFAAQPGPRLAIVKLKAPERTELFTVDPFGGGRDLLYAANAEKVPAVFPFSGPAWSPDGERIAFTALTGQTNTRFSSWPRTMLALVGADGGAVEPILRTVGGFEPVFSPDGESIAFARDLRRHRPNDRGGADIVYRSTSIWLVELGSGGIRQLTPWRNRLVQFPSSFSPDGTRLALTRTSGDRPPEAVAMGLDGSAETVFARNAQEPVFSPDGSQVAFVRGPVKRVVTREKGDGYSSVSVTYARLTDIFVRNSTGGGLRRVTDTKWAAESTPRWDPSGQRLAYTMLKPLRSGSAWLGFGDAVMEVNVDGTCATKVVSERLSIHYAAAWQPGPGREAGPIAC